MEIRDYNGTGLWTRAAIIERYQRYCRDLKVREPAELHGREHIEGDKRWVYPVMDEIIPLIDRGDAAAIALGVELVEEEQFMPFGRTIKANTARALRRAELTPEQVGRLRRKIVGLLISGTIRREFQQYARLLQRIGVGDWWPEIEQRVDRTNKYAMRYVAYLQRDAHAVPR